MNNNQFAKIVRPLLFVGVTLVILCANAAMVRADQDKNEEMSATLRDVRIVSDLAEMPIDIEPNMLPTRFVIATVVPDKESGVIVGRTKDPLTGEFVALPKGKKSSIIISGKLILLSKKDGKDNADVELRYEWRLPVLFEGEICMGLTMDPYKESLYSPFIKGGTVVCPRDVSLDYDQFGKNTYLLPQAWTPYLEETEKTLTSRPNIPVTSPDYAIALKKYCMGENPILAIAAYRRLIQTQGYSPELVRSALNVTDKYRRAAITNLTVSYTFWDRASTLPKQDLSQSIIQQNIETAHSPDDLASIVLGIASVPGASKIYPGTMRMGLSPDTQIQKAEVEQLFKSALQSPLISVPGATYLHNILFVSGYAH